MRKALSDGDVKVAWEVLEVFRDKEKIGANSKSLHVSFTFEHKGRTLKDGEVKAIVEKISDHLKQKLGALIR